MSIVKTEVERRLQALHSKVAEASLPEVQGLVEEALVGLGVTVKRVKTVPHGYLVKWCRSGGVLTEEATITLTGAVASKVRER